MEKVKPSLLGSGFLATGNAGKLREMIPLCAEYFQIDSTRVEGCPPSGAVESEDTFTGNARIKSQYVFEALKKSGQMPSAGEAFWILSDDSGLSVDALEGKPGVHSARYAGDHVSSEAHMQKLVQALKDSSSSPPHLAHYTCALSLIIHDSSGTREFMGEGECHGEIILDAKGDSGFGYDPIFYVPQFGKTFAETSYEEKNSISHRRRAFEELQKILMKSLSLFLPLMFILSTALSSVSSQAAQSFRDYMKQVVQNEGRVQIPSIPQSSPLSDALDVEASNHAAQELIIFYSEHSGLKADDKNQNWKIEGLGKEKELPPARPERTYYNTHILKLFSKGNLLKIFRPIDTTTGCSSGCSPVSFHLAYDITSKKIEVLSDPQNPLQKVGHQNWTAEDIKKINTALAKMPSWFEKLPAPSDTTHQEQTWPIYEKTLVAEAAYTSYRILEASLQLLEHNNPKQLKQRASDLNKLSNDMGDAFRLSNANDAHTFYKKLSAPPSSYLESRFQSSMKALLLPWILENDPKFTINDLFKALQSSSFKNLPSLQCFVMEEVYLNTQSAQKLLLALRDNAKQKAAATTLCPELPSEWLSVVAGKPLPTTLKEKLLQNLTLPEFLKHRPETLTIVASSLSPTGDSELRKRLFSFLSAQYPRNTTFKAAADATLLKEFEAKLKEEFRATLGPNLGTIPKATLKSSKASKSLPIKGKQIYIFFASWCSHCKHLLGTLKEEIKDSKLWDRIQLLENFSNSNTLTEALTLCSSLNLPKKVCAEMLLVPNDQSSNSLAAKVHLYSIPKVIITDPNGNIIDFDFKFEEEEGADPLRKLKWILNP